METQMDVTVDRIRAVVTAGLVLGLWASYVMINLAIADRRVLWIALSVLTLFGTGLSTWGMWWLKRWALWLSCGVSVVIFAFGCFTAHILQNLSPVEESNFMSEVELILKSPSIMSFFVCPILWILYFTQAKVRKHFR